MVDLNYIHICEYATLSKGDKPVLMGIFTRLESKEELPLRKRDMYLVINVSMEDEQEHLLEVKFKTPADEDLLPFSEKLKKEGGKEGHGIMLNVGGIEFEEEGVYKVEVYSDGELIGKKELIVEVNN